MSRVKKSGKRAGWAAVLAAAVVGVSGAGAWAAPVFEGFEPTSSPLLWEWYTANLSDPEGTVSWFLGSDTVFPAQAGTSESWIGSNFNATTGAGTISSWLLSPAYDVPAGATVSFWSRTTTPGTTLYPDRMEFRLRNAGTDPESLNVGTTATSVGDFGNNVLTINPGLTTTGYPSTWTQYSYTLPSAYSGRFAFRYFVEDGGPSGSNSDLIGVDSFAITDATVLTPFTGFQTPPTNTPQARYEFGTSLSGTIAAGEVDWYKFDHTGGDVVLSTVGSTLSPGNDTEIGLYRADGTLVASNDDAAGFLSQLVLAELPAGQYFFCVGGWDTVFGTTGFEVLSSSDESGTYVVNGLTLVTSSLVKGDFGGSESKDGSFNSPDGSFDEFDTEGYFLAVNDPTAYLALNPSLTAADLVTLGDFGGAESKDGSFNTPDGSFDEFDTEGFFLALNNPTFYASIQPGSGGRPGISAIPEPAAMGLLAPAGLLLSRRRRV